MIHSETEQETNDLSKAFFLNFYHRNNLLLSLGATGKREDHTIGNVSLLTDYMEKAEVNMMTDYGIFVPIKEDSMFESYIYQQITIFNMNSAVFYLNVGYKQFYPLSVFELLASDFELRTSFYNIKRDRKVRF